MLWLRQQRSKRPPFKKQEPKKRIRRNSNFDEELRHLQILGRYFGELRRDTSEWLIRRVDTVEMLDSAAGSSAVRTSLMLDGLNIAEIKRRFSSGREELTYIPLPAMEKHLLGRFDVRCGDGDSAVPVLPRIDNAHVAVGVLVCHLVDNGFPLRLIDSDIVDVLYLVASCNSASSVMVTLADAIAPGLPGEDQDAPEIASGISADRDRESRLVNYYSGLEFETIYIADAAVNLISTVRQIKGRDFSASFARHLSDYLASFVPIAVLEKLPAVEFLVKVYVSSSALKTLHGVHAYVRLNDGNSGWSEATATQFRFCIGLFVFGVALGSWAAGLMGVAFLLSLRLGEQYRDHGGKWLIGRYSFASYSKIVGARIPPMRLSGFYLLQSSFTNLGLPGSQHYRMSIPKGVTAILAKVSDGAVEINDVEPDIADDWVAAHSGRSNGKIANLTIKVGVIPRSQSFLRHSFYAAIVTSFLLAVGLASHFGGMMVSEACPADSDSCPNFGLAHLVARSSGSIVTVLMIAPSVYTIILLQQNEHEFTSMLLSTMRGVVGVCALISASVAIPLALDLPTAMVVIWWAIGLLASFFSCWHLAATRYYHGVLLNLRSSQYSMENVT